MSPAIQHFIGTLQALEMTKDTVNNTDRWAAVLMLRPLSGRRRWLLLCGLVVSTMTLATMIMVMMHDGPAGIRMRIQTQS